MRGGNTRNSAIFQEEMRDFIEQARYFTKTRAISQGGGIFHEEAPCFPNRQGNRDFQEARVGASRQGSRQDAAMVNYPTNMPEASPKHDTTPRVRSDAELRLLQDFHSIITSQSALIRH